MPDEVDLFGNPVESGSESQAAERAARKAINNIDVVLEVVKAATSDLGYVLGPRGRQVFRKDGSEEIRRVSWQEGNAVHQLLDQGWLTVGGQHSYRLLGGREFVWARSILVPKATRQRLHHWLSLRRPESWSQGAHRSQSGTEGRA
ncbi:hypothetical protein GCM10012275_49060 [Longimycelium tulufanense]|uniref:Uncharacterized protein n=1 Tax=Longimycelium tulufanense TaxID=907463 RepID=A0A8J3CGK9_9PSEU|nr:hypothetical protein [Longimycelium tulufanense]GGM72634.1 hypothetical protein GCM10012275_49060 [Longimycelium tulufanense]